MHAIVNNFHPFSGIGKFAFNLASRTREMFSDTEMVYLESSDNRIPDAPGIRKVRQSFSYPLANRTLSAYYHFPKKVPEGYDVYHVSSHYLSRVARYRKPCIVTQLDLAPIHFPKQYPFLMRHFVKKMVANFRHADRIVASNEYARNEIAEYLKMDRSGVDVIPIGFDERLYRPMDKVRCRRELGLPLDKKIVLNVGSEEPRKNVDTLFRAQSMMARSMDDAMLVRLGDKSPAYDGLREGLDIRYFNSIPEEKMPLFYNSADIFVFPASYEGGHAYPPEEAIACGVPTIITPAVDMLKKECLVIDDQDPSRYSDAMASVLSSRAKHRKYSRMALDGSKKFTLTIEARIAHRIYEDVAAG